jgi:hypothetical protein
LLLAAISIGPPAGAPNGARTAVVSSRAHTQFGFNSWISSQNLALQKQIGLPIRRFFVYWSSAEPAQGQWNWQQSDQQYQAVLAAGLRPMIVAMGSPCWARPSNPCDDTQYTGPPDLAYDSQWTEFVRGVAQRYPQAIAIEIWNEPNLLQFFYPRIDPTRYTQLLKEAYTTIKSISNTVPVISGGLSGSPATGANASGEGDGPYLTAMYAAGAANAMDGIGIHPYPIDYSSDLTPLSWDPSQMEQTLNRIRTVRAAAHATQPIWITEVGESTATDIGAPQPVTPTQQANDLITMTHSVQADTDVRVMLVHTLQDKPTSARVDRGFGIFDASGRPKPAVCALSRAFGGTLKC